MFGKLRMEMNSGSILGYFLQALPIACLAGVICLAVRLFLLKKKKLQIKWGLELFRLLFVCYLAGLISLVILPANFWLAFYDGVFLGWWDEMGPVFQLGAVDLVPSVVECLHGELSVGSWARAMLLGNIAMFVPFGFFVPLITEIKRPGKLLLTAVIVPLCCEALQLFFGRSFDVDDLLCNFIGIVIGAGIALAVLKGIEAHKVHRPAKRHHERLQGNH